MQETIVATQIQMCINHGVTQMGPNTLSDGYIVKMNVIIMLVVGTVIFHLLVNHGSFSNRERQIKL